jgi:hypothetical protein
MSFQSLVWFAKPAVILILGDLFDEGQEAPGPTWQVHRAPNCQLPPAR